MTANIGKGNPTRLVTETDFLDFVKDLLNIVKEESHKRMVDAEEMSQRTKDKANLQWYFRGYKDGVKVPGGVLGSASDRRRLEDAT